MKRLTLILLMVVALAATTWLQTGLADPGGEQPQLLAYQVATPTIVQHQTMTPIPRHVRSDSCAGDAAYQIAAGGESCGCKASQACCDAHDRCCPATHPHHCTSGNCYATAAEAQQDCGNNYEICGVPQ